MMATASMRWCGAQVPDILRMVLRQGMSFVLLGEIVGIAAAYMLTDYVYLVLYGVTPTDTATFVAVVVLLFLVALVACYVPARRATKVDPLVALK